jgi:hypothetical protein
MKKGRAIATNKKRIFFMIKDVNNEGGIDIKDGVQRYKKKEGN